MDERMKGILENIDKLQEELEQIFDERRDKLEYDIREGKARFAQEVKRRHKQLKVGLFAYLKDADLLSVLTSPFIYMNIIPFALIDLTVSLYQMVCFPVYGIPKVKRSRYIRLDRHRLAYLNVIEKLNCAYCGYCNGVLGFVREVSARTETYWCPIKHSGRVRGAHPRYRGFTEYGDPDEYRERLAELRDRVRNLKD